MIEPIKTPPNIELNQAQQYLSYWENSGREQQLQAAQAYALIAVARELQTIARKLGGIDTEIQFLRGRLP